MLDINSSIKSLDNSDISDNLFHYEYNVNHLLSLIRQGISVDDPRYLSAYRSFEGEVFENFVYEKLLRYAGENDEIEQFVLKGFHQNKMKACANTLSISEKQQIVYRTKSREISEFDAMFITKDKELYFIEMTLVKSVLKLRKRLRKKRALLEIIFPDYEIKSLIVLNEGATGIRQFPSYCTVWLTEAFCAKDVLDYIVDKDSKVLAPKKIVKSPKMIEAHTLNLYNFKYYNTISWITRSIRSSKKDIINMEFLLSDRVQRYHDLYNKLYIGYIPLALMAKKLSIASFKPEDRVVVALEKKHTNEIVVTYYVQLSRKNLFLYSYENGSIVKEKKDPYGITVTEVYHVNKLMDDSYILGLDDIEKIKGLCRQAFKEHQ